MLRYADEFSWTQRVRCRFAASSIVYLLTLRARGLERLVAILRFGGGFSLPTSKTCSNVRWRFCGMGSSACPLTGKLVYSTCSLEREENEDVVASLGSGVKVERTLRRTPGIDAGDGFFAAVLTKTDAYRNLR